MKTIPEVLLEVRKHRNCSRMHLYRLLSALNIRPGGARQRPQRYPDDTGLRILTHLGFRGNPGRLVSMRQLKSERRAR